MINLKYRTWVRACDIIAEYANKYGKYYAQLYPLCHFNNLDEIKTEEYFIKYIKNGAFLCNEKNFSKISYDIRKSDGTFRKRNLITPVMYIYYVAIGVHISVNNKENIRESMIDVYYAGNFKENDLHYRNAYNEFIKNIEVCANEFTHYMKLDLKNFFDKINLNILNKQISEIIKFNSNEKLIMKELLMHFGDGFFPQLECGITSSYLATQIYLAKSDNQLFKYLKKEGSIKEFKMCRYVDDLYIFMNIDGRVNTKKIVNGITFNYETILSSFNLELNLNKCTEIKKIINLYDDIKSFSLITDETISEEMSEVKEYRNCLKDFLIKISNYNKNNGLYYLDYIKILNECFETKEFKSNTSQILNSMVYREHKWISENKIIVKKLIEMIDKDFNILCFDSRRLVSLICNIKNEDLINKFLNQLYLKLENKYYILAYKNISLQYLLSRNFSSIKLLNKLKIYNEEFYLFIFSYYKNNWTKNIIPDNLKLIIEKLDYNKTPLLFTKFLEIIEFNKGNIVYAHAYNKNYFDSITKCFENKLNPNVGFSKIYYQKSSLINFYKNELFMSEDKINLINNICDNRNENPICHANLSKNNNEKSFLESIKEVNDLVDYVLNEKIS